MATLRQVVDGDSARLNWLELEDSDGKRWKYSKGGPAAAGALVHIAQRPDKKLEILLADDGKPRLRQEAPGLPTKMVVHLQPDAAGRGSDIPVMAGWSGGNYEYHQQ